MRPRILFALVFFCFFGTLTAQMTIDGNIFYGNEWIDFNKTYYKIPVAEDGLYRLTADDLTERGIALSEFAGREIAIFHNGQSIPIHVSNDKTWNTDDFLLFHGEKNRSFLDQFMYEGGEDWLLNKDYSLINDTAAYFLVFDESQAIRYGNYENKPDISLTPKAWQHELEKEVYHKDYVKPYTKVGGLPIYPSHFIKNEGWASQYRRTWNLTFTPEDYLDVGLPAQLEIKLIGDYDPHNISIKIDNQEVVNEPLSTFEMKDYKFTILPEDMQDGKLQVSIRGTIDGRDRYHLVHTTLTYTRDMVLMDGGTFKDILGDNRYYEIPGPGSEEEAWVISGGKIFKPLVQDGEYIINGTDLVRGDKIEIYSDAAIRDAEILSIHDFQAYAQMKDAEYLILTSQKIIDNAPSVQAYADYRASMRGGGFNVAIVAVEDLYNEYAYGVNRHPMAIKNFMFYLDHIESQLKYVFIIGKGIHLVDSRTEEDFESPLIQEFRVPSFGYPTSDDLLMSPLDRTEPLYAVGRLPYNTEEEIALYLDKVKVNESDIYQADVDSSIWKKRILHLNGGGASEYEIIDYYFGQFKNVGKTSILHPAIVTFARTTNAPVQFHELEKVFNEINRGVKFVTFFGHSSSNILAFDLGRGKAYHNYDQMPFLLALGCSAGDLNVPGESLGEIYGGYETGGFIGILSSTSFGFIGTLANFGEEFYQLALNNADGDRLGIIIKNALINTGSNRRQSEQLMFMGDPALLFSVPQGSDPALDASLITSYPDNPNINSDSFLLQFILTNLGSDSRDSILVEVEHELPTGEVRNYTVGRVSIPQFQDTIRYSIAIDSSMAGFNYFNVVLNSDKAVVEWPDSIAYENNEIKEVGLVNGYEVYILGGTAEPVYPLDFSIIPDSISEFVISGSPLVGDTTLVTIQIDTTALFNSPSIREVHTSIAGGSKRIKMPYRLKDSIVYYWRLRSTNLRTLTQSDWETRSFIYLEGKTGWNQSHYYQFKEDEFTDMRLSKERIFLPGPWVLSYQVFNRIHNDNNGITASYNGSELNQSKFWLPHFTGAYIYVADKKTVSIVTCPPGGKYGAINTKSFPLRTFPYDVKNDSSRINMMNFLENIVQDSQYVFIALNQYFITDSFDTEEWQADSLINNGKNIYNVLESFGAKKIRKLSNGKDFQYTLMFQMGGEVYDEAVGSYEAEGVGTTADYVFHLSNGYFTSPQIQNVKKLHTFTYKVHSLDTTDFHRIRLNSVEGDSLLLIDSLAIINEFRIDSLNKYSINQYHLQWKFQDKINRTFPQVDYWRLYMDYFGDYLITAGNKFLNSDQVIKNFDTLDLDFYIHNISHDFLDSAVINIRMINDENQLIYEKNYQLDRGIKAFDSLYQDVTIPVNTNSQNVKVEIELVAASHYKERILTNNILLRSFRIKQDKIGPSISVYFDNNRISNGDIVSPTSTIKVAITDKTEVIPLSDTSNIDFSITDPDGAPLKYSFASAKVDFVPADSSKAHVIIKGDFKKEGLYNFSVNASDKSGNSAGKVSYSVDFRIILENGISYFINYPNPVHNYTRFKYILTGSTPPVNYTVTIVNSMGEIVTVLSEDELGPMQIGAHSTQKWNAGGINDQVLAPGVYYYKLELESNEEYEHIKSEFDQNFKNAWGKMIIIR